MVFHRSLSDAMSPQVSRILLSILDNLTIAVFFLDDLRSTHYFQVI